jgi:hypothetical protein
MRRVWMGACVVVVVAVGCDEPTPLARPPGSLSGRICNPLSEQVVAGATVTITWTEAGVEKSKSDVTDDNGAFLLEGVGEGAQTLVVTADEFTNAYPVDIPSGDAGFYVDAACRDRPLEPGVGSLVGQICNPHKGKVVTDAVISVTLADDTVISTTTDPETGEFRLDGVPAGTVKVVVNSPTYTRYYVVELAAGETLVVEQSATCAIPDGRTTGFIRGSVCAPGTDNEPLAGAAVTVRYRGNDGVSYVDGPYLSLADGSFVIDPIGPTPATNVVVRAEIDGFATSWNVASVASRLDDLDGTVLTPEGECVPLVVDNNQRYLVVTGDSDRIQDVLARMNLNNVDEYDGFAPGWAEELFATRDLINSYDAVFINCGADEGEIGAGLSPNARNNIRNYVQQGGALYVSDWAYDIIEQVFPDKINFYGADTAHDAAEVAREGTYTATVLDDGLRAVVGDSFTMNISFLLGVVIQEVAPDVTVYLETDMTYVRTDGILDRMYAMPMTVGFSHGVGTVVFTAFHQEQGETLDGPEDAMLRYLVFEL